jgi:hypothetical protein
MGNPDVYQQGTLNKSATKTLTLPAYPKLVIYIRVRSGGDYHGCSIYDFEHMTGGWATYGASGNDHAFNNVLEIPNSGITEVSNTSITLKNSMSYTIRYIFLIWC